jgi:peptidoglycan/xylan/chitin deacetylase (PgdA/CDA1 family)
MVKWPDGKKCAVLFTFDVDAETLWLSRNKDSWNSPEALSRGAYGPKEGVPRILDLLDKHDIKGTFFIPGWVIEKYEDMAREIHKRGHELGYHGYLHEFDKNITYDQENELMEKCEGIIKRITGKRPVGQRSPMGEVLPHTVKLLCDREYIYASNLKDSDSPYFHKLDGKDAPLVELPTEWMYDDSSYYFFTLQEPARRGIAPASTVYEIWKEEFDGLYEEGKIFTLIIHPQISGRPSRIKAMDKLITYMKSREGTWIARADEVARYLLEANKQA